MSRSAGLVIATGVIVVCAVNVLPAPPACNWDMVGYTAVAYHRAGFVGEELLETTFADVARVCPRQLDSILRGTPYRDTVSTDASALEAQLGVYDYKLAYAYTLGRVARSGRSPAAATIWIDRLGYLITGLVLAFWLGAVLRPGIALASAALVMSIPAVAALGVLSTPDSMSAAVLRCRIS